MVDSQMHVPLSYQRVQYICSGMPCLAFPLHWTGKEGVIMAFGWLTLRGQVFCWMLSVCLCWHKLSAGWLASGRLPAVTFTMRVRWPYCEDATPLCIPPHIPKPTESHPQVKNRGLKCPGCPSSLSSKHFYISCILHTPSASTFWHRFYSCSVYEFALKTNHLAVETLYTMYEIMLWGSTTIFRLTKFYVRDLISTFPMSELKSM